MNSREALREINRNRAAQLLRKNQHNQNLLVNRSEHQPRIYVVDDLVFVIKYLQSKGKLDSRMRGPYRITKVLPNGRYELKLLSGSKGKSTQAAAQYMVPWKGEWCPEFCAIFFDGKILKLSNDFTLFLFGDFFQKRQASVKLR